MTRQFTNKITIQDADQDEDQTVIILPDFLPEEVSISAVVLRCGYYVLLLSIFILPSSFGHFCFFLGLYLMLNENR